jgi:hypothetical protein
MDQAETTSNTGLLKISYEESPQLEALRRRQKKLELKTKGDEYERME